MVLKYPLISRKQFFSAETEWTPSSNELLSLFNTATLLGIALDVSLTWIAHAQAVEQRCLKRLNALRTTSGSSWGASKSSLLQVYRATIRSVKDYGCEAADLGSERIKSVYEKIQAQALAICCGMEPALYHCRWSVENLYTLSSPTEAQGVSCTHNNCK